MSLSSLGIVLLDKKKKRPVQSADWSSITTSVQTPNDKDANLPLWAQCGGSRDTVEHVSVGGNFYGLQAVPTRTRLPVKCRRLTVTDLARVYHDPSQSALF
ncbi:hypothetical protein PCH_Pc21g02890 [Penicillium rubens Wisconsin 54-1255]|uniref:Uncharacterized protein n=1 Tax=Penicillium rubens (strain ATCC 28089 / DSM 1075 / NRRL 1951 / Wisconsin 54-1255) TaxID=500485 RepID=B6HKD6_PENRW|nr:hypothetical protein PCH_Pc21g02890 [Penicillium rubens Wisconsin 54-1255]